jgi:hypothetical protein
VITPIETHYNGYRFRSRLEARWAVFFDRAGFEYRYEAEGYRLPSGLYLPDFYLPDAKPKHTIEKGPVPRYVEVKPGPCPYGPLGELPDSIYDLVEFCVLPEPPPREVQLGIELAEGTGVSVTIVYGTDPLDVIDGHGGVIVLGEERLGEDEGFRLSVCPDLGPFNPKTDPKLLLAARGARAARFEHGEQLAPRTRPGWAR